MTPHGMVQTSAEDAKPSATGPRASMVTADANMRVSGLAPCRHHRAEVQRSGLSASISVLPSGGRAIVDISRRSKSP
jgi:hypothetical protein